MIKTIQIEGKKYPVTENTILKENKTSIGICGICDEKKIVKVAKLEKENGKYIYSTLCDDCIKKYLAEIKYYYKCDICKRDYYLFKQPEPFICKKCK